MFEHGSYTIEVRQRIVIVHILDAWNLKTALHFCKEMEKVAETMSGSPWAILSDLTQWQLSTPEVGAEIARQAVKLDALGRTHNAMVANDHGIRQVVVSEAIMTGTRKPVVEFFNDKTAALEWLAICGFE